MREGARQNEDFINEGAIPEKKYTVDSFGYRQYEMNCAECQQNFTRNIPNNWFNGDDEIKAHNLPDSITLADAQAVLDNPNCGECDPEIKAKLQLIEEQNSKQN